jgi:dihydrofolate reductase
MTKIVVDMTISVDGFVAGPDDTPSQPLGGNGGLRLHDWLLTGPAPYPGNNFFRPEGRNRDLVDKMFKHTGALLTGRRTYDLVNGWNGSHPIPGLPIVVLTHSLPAKVPKGKSDFTFSTDGVAAAAAAARAMAKGRDVMVHGASTACQLLDANLVDELFLHIAPLLLGDGRPLFVRGVAPMSLECIETVETPQANHVRYRVVHR